MLTDELFNLYKDNVEVGVRTEAILKPKRRYKRPDLQRLANRWYGMVDTGQIEVDIKARPKKDRYVEISCPPVKLARAGVYTESSINLVRKEYKLPVMGFKFICPRVSAYFVIPRKMEEFWKSVREIAVIEINSY